MFAGLISSASRSLPLPGGALGAQSRPHKTPSSSSSATRNSGCARCLIANPKYNSRAQADIDSPPALVDPNGPAISLQTSAALFYVAAGLNACGYDDELEGSDPVRLRVREQMRLALAASETARSARDGLCAYIAQHRLTSSSRDLGAVRIARSISQPPPELGLAFP